MNSSLAELENLWKMVVKLFFFQAPGTSAQRHSYRELEVSPKPQSQQGIEHREPARTDAGDLPEQNPAPAEGGRAIQTAESRSDYLAADAEIKVSRETPRQTSN